MPARQLQRSTTGSAISPIGIDESELWSMADALRGSMDAAEYKHVVLGLIFPKYISDAFEGRHAAVLAEWGEETAEDPDEYTAESIFWVPPKARWAHLRGQARQPTIGEPFAEKMTHLVAELHEQQAEGARLDTTITANLESLGFAKERP